MTLSSRQPRSLLLRWVLLGGIFACALAIALTMAVAQSNTTAAAQSNSAAGNGDGIAKPKASEPPAPAGKKADQDEDDRIVIEHADNFRYDPTTKTYHMRGNVVFTNKDVRLECDEADYNEEEDTGKARGHLRVTDPNSIITGDLIDADFGEKLAIITGNVTILTQKKQNESSKKTADLSLEKPGKNGNGAGKGESNPAGSKPAPTAEKSKDEDKPEHVQDYWEKKTTITCERVEYYYDDAVKKMIATPRVKALQEDKTVWADKAVFEDPTRLVTLTGNVILTTEKGDEMRCARAVIHVDEDWVQAEGMSGMTLRKRNSESKKANGQPAAAPEKPEAAPAPPAATETTPPAPAEEDKE